MNLPPLQHPIANGGWHQVHIELGKVCTHTFKTRQSNVPSNFDPWSEYREREFKAIKVLN